MFPSAHCPPVERGVPAMYQGQGSSAHLVSLVSCTKGDSTCQNGMMYHDSTHEVRCANTFFQLLAVTSVWKLNTMYMKAAVAND